MPMGFDGAYTMKNWGVSWLLLPRISNWKAAELTDHFSSTFLIGLTWVTEVAPSANVMAQEHPYLGTVIIFKKSMESIFLMTTICAQ